MSRTGKELQGIRESYFNMNSWVYFLGAMLLFSVSLLLRKNTEPYCECGAGAYAWRRLRRLAGTILLVVAGLTGIVGLLALAVSATSGYPQQN